MMDQIFIRFKREIKELINFNVYVCCKFFQVRQENLNL